MHLCRFMRHVRRNFYRKHIDWTLKSGDLVVTDSWPKPIEIIDINWALQAAAVRLSPDAIIVWPLWNLRRYEG
jgi:hypothetical protein